MKHSKLGIASFIISTVSILLAFVSFFLILVMMIAIPTGSEPDEPVLALIGCCFIFYGFISFVSGCLGIAALFQPNTKKVFSILGTVFAILPIAAVIFFAIIGSMS